MPLPILAVLVVLGIGSIILVVHYSGLSSPVKIEDRSHALEILHRDYPDISFDGDICITTNSNAALLAGSNGQYAGLVEIFGDRFVTRVLYATDIISVQEDATSVLKVSYSDFTLRQRTYEFTSTDDKNSAKQMLTQLKEQS